MEQARITSHQGTQGPQAARSKAPTQKTDQGAGAQAAAGSGDFLSLLAALGDAGLQQPLELQADGLELETAVDPAAADAAALAALQGGFLPWQLPDATGTQATAEIAARSGVLGASLKGVGAGMGEGLLGGLLPQDGLVAQTALLDTALDGQADKADAAATPGSLLAPPAGAGRRKAVGMSQAGDAPTLGGIQAMGATGSKASISVQSPPGLAIQPQLGERRDAVVMTREAAAPVTLDGAAAVAAQLSGVAEAAPGGRTPTQGGEPGARDGGAWGQVGESHEPRDATLADGGSMFADPGMAPTEDAVAEQVAFWVHQNIQNAELTVKHDGKPVEVSVSLTGNEAHVAFRSDQAQTRELLDASVSQLRDMLHQEGLVLSGVSVGDSGAQSGQGGAQQGQQGAPRQAQVVVPAESGARSRSGADVLSDRAVDIFV